MVTTPLPIDQPTTDHAPPLARTYVAILDRMLVVSETHIKTRNLRNSSVGYNQGVTSHVAPKVPV